MTGICHLKDIPSFPDQRTVKAEVPMGKEGARGVAATSCMFFLRLVHLI